MNLAATKYRLTYEAFSQFSTCLSKVENVEELSTVISKRYKYLFDGHLFRLSFCKETTTDVITIAKEQKSYQRGFHNLHDYEKDLLHDHIPYCEALNTPLFYDFINYPELKKPLLWGWYFKYGEQEVCASIVADDHKKFNTTDIDILHLFVDAVSSKFQELQLKDSLKLQNKKLEEALAIIEKKNLEVIEIINNQRAIIASRTLEIRDRNDKLLEISKMNAHYVREPLSRILGLIELANHCEPQELNTNVFLYLKQSAQDLDASLRHIIKLSAGDIDKLKIDQLVDE